VADRIGRAPFTDEDLNLLLALAGQATIAVENLRLHDEIKKANELLQEYDRLKSEFVGIVAHDFRRPLMAIRGFAELVLEEEDLPLETRREFMRTVISETDHLALLANDTLLITQIETGQLSFNFREVDVGPFLLEAVPMGLSDHSVLMDVPPGFPRIWADPDRLRQVITNLVSNAVKYSPGGGSIVVRVRERGAQHIVIEVVDHGLGIPPEQIGRLFQKFARVRGEEHQKVSGTGLGLYICRLIVEGHGGQIWVESELGKGSTFGMALPVDARLATGRRSRPRPGAEEPDPRADPPPHRRAGGGGVGPLAPPAPPQDPLHLGEAGVDRDRRVAVRPGRAWKSMTTPGVLEDVPGQDRHHRLAPPYRALPHQPARPRHRGRRGGLAADPGGVHHRLGLEDLPVAHGGDQAPGLADRPDRAVVAGRVPDADRGGHGLRLHPVAPAEAPPEAPVERGSPPPPGRRRPAGRGG
jgi:nitrogen-specific signal transduction histidine kinase